MIPNVTTTYFDLDDQARVLGLLEHELSIFVALLSNNLRNFAFDLTVG